MIALGTQPWQSVAAEKQAEIYNALPAAYLVAESLLQDTNSTDLPRLSSIMTRRELEITESRAVDIVERVKTREYSSVEVATAFCKRASLAHQATNCLAAVLFDNALEQARKLDAYMEQHGKPVGPLHGLPISVKEHIYLEGTVATSGLIAWKDAISPGDALIVKIFREAGAVFHVKTTNPQTLMALETHSNLFGRTVNPFNKNLTCGGSSGGEAALLGMRGSVLGIGTDIGGSIRGPSAFCGGYGLKPSIARIPHSGLSGLHAGMENIIGCVGPMANCVEDLRLFCDVALACEPWNFEPSLIGIPWKPLSVNNLPKKLTIGVMWHDSLVMPHPPITRALRETVDVLRAAGHYVVEWDPKHHLALHQWINRAYFLDGAHEYLGSLDESRDPPVPIIKWLLDSYGGTRRTLEETWQLNMERDLLRTLYAAQWRSAGIDVILSPVNPSVASAHDESTYWGYTSAFNALDLPGSVFPVDSVKPGEPWAQDVPPLSPMDHEYRKYYNNGGAAKYRDAPVALQLVGKRLQEEKLLCMTEVIQNCVARAKASYGPNATDFRDQEPVPTHKEVGSHQSYITREQDNARHIERTITKHDVSIFPRL